MSAFIEMDAVGKIGNVVFRGNGPDSSLVITGDRCDAFGLTVSNESVNGNIVVQSNDCHIYNIEGAISQLAIIEVTGDRALIQNVTSQLGTSGCAVRLNGSNGSVVNGVTSRADENGLIVLDSDRWQATDIYVEASDTAGIIIDGSNNGRLEAIVYQAGQHGIRVLDSDRNRLGGLVIDAGKDTNNTYDGVFIEGDSDRNRTEFTVTYPGTGNRMRYGLNISAATVDNHVEASILDGTGATGNYNNAGTGTVVTDDHLV